MPPQFSLSSQRLTLRLIQPTEAEQFMLCVDRSNSLHQWVDWCHPQFSLQESERFLLATRLNWVRGDAYGFGLFRHTDGVLIGMVAVNELYHTYNMASIGYWVADVHQGKGYAKEGIQTVLDFCFDILKISRVEIVCDPSNKPSHSVAQSCGAKQETLARNRFIFDGEPRDGLVFSIIPKDIDK
ncbi:GNAT family protein [Vibrio sp. YMD68]|uniref:GNAT family N-acetyltransferase n=1 Tax=Vibrio sp. YMD68 TaxID=3042300 RepID=UPI00249A99D6|nr:GNAT family protein [Vibrio sp. YMD68]WGV99379.1 GNAT family protein [Vibrio sp. YMD68]